MTRDEIINREAEDPEATRIEHALVEDARSIHEGLWVRLQPVPDRPALDLDDREYELLLMEPARTRNRPEGWNFANAYQRPTRALERLVQNTANMKRVELLASGGIALHAPNRELRWREEDLYPLAIVEYTTSVFRLASAVYSHAGLADRDVVMIAGLYGIKGEVLHPGSPLHELFRLEPGRTYDDADIPLSPRRLRLHEIVREPDRCASRLWREFYRAFGYDESAWPHEYDTGTGKLVIGRR
jgi:hypothetical protein